MIQDESEVLLPTDRAEAAAETRPEDALSKKRHFYGALGAVLAGLIGWGFVSIARCEETVFCGGSALVAGFLSGHPIMRVSEGWLISTSVPVVVTTACSGITYFVMVAALVGWHLSRRGSNTLVSTCVAALITVLAVVAINGLRIMAVAQLHSWVLPRLPEAYGAFLHMLTGVAVFLPAFIVANLILEKHGRPNTDTGNS
ncbi:MAG: exosortase/archaeosortase family protein [Nibricoccus sp.]